MVGTETRCLCAILSTMEQQELIEKIKRLPRDRVAEVEDFVDSLARREHNLNRRNLHQALSDYAVQHAGTSADLDSDLEAAATDHLLQQTQNNEAGRSLLSRSRSSFRVRAAGPTSCDCDLARCF